MRLLLFIPIFLLSFHSFAQSVFLRSGEIKTTQSLNQTEFTSQADVNNNYHYGILQFTHVVNEQYRQQLQQETGILFFDYLPKYAYLVAVPNQLNWSSLQNKHIKTIIPFTAKYKVDPRLYDRPFPYFMQNKNGKINVLVEFQNNIDNNEIINLFAKNKEELPIRKNNQVWKVTIAENKLAELANYSIVKYILPASHPGDLENREGRSNHRVNTIDQSYPGGNHYNGNGINVGIGDDGLIGPHIDFKGRNIPHTSVTNGDHGDHCSGIIGGAGNMDPNTVGNAPGINLHTYQWWGNIDAVYADYATDTIRLLSNSLGQTCNAGYDGDARELDSILVKFPSLLSIHSAGNSGSGSCGGVNGFYQITGGYKAGKNAIAVGNLQKDDSLASSSSRGPAEDGRLKPEVCAVGTNVISTVENNLYDSYSGTSMACPGTAGTLAALYSAYKALHNNAEPNGAIIKNVLMNTADDLGNAGPDFKYGYGRINARRALEVLKNNQIITDSITNADSNLHTLIIPSNVTQVKVMVYWHDRPAASMTTLPLINDLDMRITNSSNTITKPLILKYGTNVTNLNTVAFQGNDSVNNHEQIVLTNPTAGSYTIKIYGKEIPYGKQGYSIVYTFITNNIVVTYPNGGESFQNTVSQRLRWDAVSTGGNFTAQYSSNAGNTWTTISSTIPSNRRFLDWTPPLAIKTGQMKIKISNTSGQSDESDTLFTCFPVPQFIYVDTACQGYYFIRWDSIFDASHYTIYLLGDKYMDSIGTSTNARFGFTVPASYYNQPIYVAVSAFKNSNGAKGQRTIAKEITSGTYACNREIINAGLIVPNPNLLSCNLSSFYPKILVKNIGSFPVSNIDLSYKINLNGTLNIENYSPILNPGDSFWHTFTTPITLTNAGTYTLFTSISSGLDLNIANNNRNQVITVANLGITTFPVSENFEGAIFPNTDWTIENPNFSPWYRYSCSAGIDGLPTQALSFGSFGNTNFVQSDILRTNYLDIPNTNTDSVFLYYDIAYRNHTTNADQLIIKVSDDCNNTFDTLVNLTGQAIATASASNVSFFPNNVSEWKTKSVLLDAYKGKEITVNFEWLNGNGNNVYLDNINIKLRPKEFVGINNSIKESMTIFPNPAKDFITIKNPIKFAQNTKIDIINALGEIVQSTTIDNLTTKELLINVSTFAKGVYEIKVMEGNKVETFPMIKL